MEAPDIATAGAYLKQDESDDSFKIEYEALKEWFEEEFAHITEVKSQLKLAFLKNLKYNLKDIEGIKTIKDIDASVTYFDKTSASKPWLKIYEKYKCIEPEPENKTFIGFLSS